MLNRTTRNLIVATILLIVLLGGLIVLGNINARNGVSLTNALQTIANEQALEEVQTATQALLDRTAEERATLNSYIIDGDGGTIDLLSELDQVARSYNVTINTTALEVLAKDKKDKSPYDILELTISFTGFEGQTQDFVNTLEAFPYASTLMQVSLIRDTKDVTTVSGTVILNLTITNV